MSEMTPVYDEPGPYIIVESESRTLWLSTAYTTLALALDQIEADVQAGIAERHHLTVVPLRTLDFVRGDHHPRQRADTGA